MKDISQKNELHTNYKICRNLISSFMKRSKQNYYSKHFEGTWKGIKSIISMRSSPLITPTLFTFQNETIDNPKRIANIFKKYFNTISKRPNLE